MRVKAPLSSTNAILDDEFNPEEISELSAKLERIISAFK
jgi:hypothetical protein